MDLPDQCFDGLRVGSTRHEETIRARLAVGVAAFDRLRKRLVGTGQIDIRSGRQDKWNARSVGGASSTANASGCVLDRMQGLRGISGVGLDVRPDHSSENRALDGAADLVRVRTVTSLKIGTDRQWNRRRNRADPVEHHLAAHAGLLVRKPQREAHARARCGDGGEAERGEHQRTTGVPRIGHQKNRIRRVQLLEAETALELIHGEGPGIRWKRASGGGVHPTGWRQPTTVLARRTVHPWVARTPKENRWLHSNGQIHRSAVSERTRGLRWSRYRLRAGRS